MLGAGTSRQANLPTATDVIDDLKRRYYCSEENQQLTTKDLQNPAVRERVDAFMTSRGFPERWASDEYTAHFEGIFGEDRERQRAYLNKMLSEQRVSLAVGNRVFGALLGSGLCRVAFTTNFDSVVEKAVAEVTGRSLSAYHLEGSVKANDALNNEEYPIYVKLHGDFRYDSLKNLADDLREQNSELSRCLVNAVNRFGLVVAGYSGRDESVMALLHKVLESNNPYPHGIFWLGMKGGKPPGSIVAFLDAARKKGLTAEYVEIETFDTLMLRVWRNLDERPHGLDDRVRKARAVSVSIPLPDHEGDKPLIRFNGLPLLELPTECYALQTKEKLAWQQLGPLLRESEHDLIVTLDDMPWCWGTEDEIRRIFDGKLIDVKRHTIPPDWREQGRLHVQRFLEDAMAKAFQRTRPLLSRRRGSRTYLIVDRHATDNGVFERLFRESGTTTGQIPGLKVPPSERGDGVERVYWAEAVQLNLAFTEDRAWVLLTPDVWISPMFARSHAADWLANRKSDRRNDKYSALLSAWSGILMDEADPGAEVSVTAFDGDAGHLNPHFRFVNRTGFSLRRARR